MTNLKTLLLAGIASATLATAASAGTYDSSSNYNAPIGMSSSSSMNAPVATSLRDANGNLVVQNGAITSSQFGEIGSASGGVGTQYSGVAGANSSATAIGNQLNVVTAGSNNIVIVDSTQINNGNQNANSTVN
ncbi:MAG TPA: holdfast anchoring protein HfaA [Rhizomicrobium sp.]|nr:holdfast anchoring protein HfaA [Rhizomicrobium sp.]